MVIMGARHPELFWLYPIVGAAGSLLGAATTFRVGQAAGESGLTHLVPARKLDRIKRRVAQSGALTLAALDLLPPPFPFTLFLVVAGALDVNRKRFFVTLGVVRFVRFALECGLGALYGQTLATQIGSRVMRNIAGVLVLLAIAASLMALVRFLRRGAPRPASRPRR